MYAYAAADDDLLLNDVDEDVKDEGDEEELVGLSQDSGGGTGSASTPSRTYDREPSESDLSRHSISLAMQGVSTNSLGRTISSDSTSASASRVAYGSASPAKRRVSAFRQSVARGGVGNAHSGRGSPHSNSSGRKTFKAAGGTGSNSPRKTSTMRLTRLPPSATAPPLPKVEVELLTPTGMMAHARCGIRV